MQRRLSFLSGFTSASLIFAIVMIAQGFQCGYVPGRYCRADSDCKTGSVCQNSACKVVAAKSTAKAGSTPATSTKSSAMATLPPGAPCSQDADCPGGLSCVSGACWAGCRCTFEYDPVCGEDGKTYTNACQAACSKIRTLCRGACPCKVARRCNAPTDCLPGYRCEDGACKRGCKCDENMKPVCATNGKSYYNRCTAACMQQKIACEGTCPCPTNCKTDKDCPSGDACFDGNCKICLCAANYDPVCGQDGNTYANTCDARCAKVSVACEGTCPCKLGCKKDTDCPGFLVCNAGLCQKKPACTCNTNAAPVCGADGKTYKNACLAKCAGVKVSCNTTCPCQASCKQNADCPDGHTCKDGACFSNACGCSPLKAPVCGTDNKTYTNACEAKCKGATLACKGACPCPKDVKCRSNRDCPNNNTCVQGTCKACGCSALRDPVCGLDGKEYGNECIARCKGVKAACKGTCPCKIACKANKDCPKAHICDKGFCASQPCKCSPIQNPVCSKDGKTYGNACEAKCKGASVACKGACPCKIPCKANKDCPSGHACNSDGFCQSSPCACSLLQVPVCGADSKTYGNECLARCQKTKVACKGKCPCPRACNDNAQCNKGEICLVHECRPCMCPLLYAPVCGNDGKTYANACEAKCQHAQPQCEGKCPCPGKCKENKDCAAGQRCNKGTCEKTCQCAQIHAPVCGTNGKTYTNLCFARCDGMRIACNGTCPCNSNCRSDQDCSPGYTCTQNRCQSCLCPLIYAPVCGTNGKTYGNACQAQCHRATVKCNNACPCPGSTPTPR